MYPPDWNEKINEEVNVPVTVQRVEGEVDANDHPSVSGGVSTNGTTVTTTTTTTTEDTHVVDEEESIGNTSFMFPPAEEEEAHKKRVHRLRFA